MCAGGSHRPRSVSLACHWTPLEGPHPPHLSFVRSRSWSSATDTGSFVSDVTVQAAPAELSVLERGLVVSDPHWKDIVKEEKRHYAHIRRTFQGQVLGYVTPVSLRSSRLHVCFPPAALPQHEKDIGSDLFKSVLMHMYIGRVCHCSSSWSSWL